MRVIKRHVPFLLASASRVLPNSTLPRRRAEHNPIVPMHFGPTAQTLRRYQHYKAHNFRSIYDIASIFAPLCWPQRALSEYTTFRRTTLNAETQRR